MAPSELQVLIDTNVFIARESDWAVPDALQELENSLRTQGHDILIHPLSKQEVRNYKNEQARKRAESKIATYAELTYPKYPTSSDTEFRKHVAEATEFNEQVDNALLYSVHTDRVDILVTEDKGIHEKARKLGIADEVFNIKGGCDFFASETEQVDGPPSIQNVTVGELDVDDPIFDSLKEEYDGFEEWFGNIPNRDAYVNWNPDGTIGAVLIIKPNEVEAIGEDPKLRKKERLQISTLKVAEERRGSKAGELLISIAVREAIHHDLEEVYLTHRIRENDYLVQLISRYGFRCASELPDGESVFVKRLTPGPGDDPDPFETSVRFYPSFYDGDHVDKFLVPIQPHWHNKLFTAYEKRQQKLSEYGGEFSSEGNAIKKAYLSKANIKRIKQGDLLLFYRSHDHREITSLGVCEQVHYGVTEEPKLQELVGRLSVFTDAEITEMAGTPTTVILFKWHFDLADPIHYQVLLDEGILAGPPQTIQELVEQEYKYIRRAGGIDERFIVN